MHWIKLYRQSIESDVFADADLWRLWCWLLMRAAYKRNHVSLKIGRGSVVASLEPGECITGRKAGGAELKWPESTFERRLKRLQAMGMIAISPRDHFSVVRIVNWCKYQTEQANGQANATPNSLFDDSSEQATNTLRTGNEQATNTNKKDKKDKKVKNVLSSSELEEWKSFWKSYPVRITPGGSKTKGSKENAFNVWKALSVNDRALAIRYVKVYSASGQIPKDCERWLRGKCWKDWIEAESVSASTNDPSQWADAITDNDDAPTKEELWRLQNQK